MRTLLALYEGRLFGQPFEPGEARSPIAGFARDERRKLASGALGAALSFWKTQWLDASEAFVRHEETPFAVFEGRSGTGAQHVPPTQFTSLESRAVRLLGARFCVTPYVVLRTALMLMLHAGCRRERIATWANFANREEPEFRNVIDWCSRSHLIVTDVTTCVTFRDLCLQLASSLERARQHEALPLTALWQSLGRNLDYCDTHINIDYWRAGTYKSEVWEVDAFVVEGGRQCVDLDIRVRDQWGAFRLSANYNTGKYDPAGLRRLLGSAKRVAMAAVSDPSVTLSHCGRLFDQSDYTGDGASSTVCL